MSRWLEILKPLEENKLLIGIAGAVVGALLTKSIPALWSGLRKLVVWLGKFVGGRFAYHSFQSRYLEWVLSEHSELKLTGVVTSDDAKRPKLEQVFVSLQVGRERIGEPQTTPNFSKLFSVPPTWRELKELVLLQRERSSSQQKIKIDDLLSQIRRNRLSLLRQRLVVIFKPNSDFIGDALERDAVSRQRFIQKYVAEFPDVVGDFQLRVIMREHSKIAVLGVPGAGKTTLLQYLALTHAKHRAVDRKLRDKRILRKRLGTTKWRLPVLIRLSSIAHLLVAPENSGRDLSILDVLFRVLPPDLQRTDLATKFFTSKLKKGNCLILLDGLDEVPTDLEFEAVVRAVKSLSATYSSNQFVITSRIAGWRTGINENFEIFYVNDLTDHQIHTFIDTWYSAVERNAVVGRLKDESHSQRKARQQRASDRAQDLKTTLSDNIGIRRLASNPMLLSIIAVVHRSLATLPRERSKLYAQCSKILLEQWDISRGVRVDDTNLKLEQKESVMRRLAYALHTGEIGDAGGGREASYRAIQKIIEDMLPTLGRPAGEGEHLLRVLIERSGIITERQRGSLSFAHHTFQEYFAAQYLATGELNSYRDLLLQPDHLMSDWWHEVILLYSGLLSDSSDFIQRIRQTTPKDDIFAQRLRLATMCLGEAIEVRKTSTRRQLTTEASAVRNRESLKDAVPVLDPEEVAYIVRWSKTQAWYSHAVVSYAKTTADRTRVISLILAALSEQQIVLRTSAIFALAQLPINYITEEVANKYITLLNDEAPEVRNAAVANVGAIRKVLPREEFTMALLELIEIQHGTEPGTLRNVFSSSGDSLSANQRTLTKLVRQLHSSELPIGRYASEIAPELLELASVTDRANFFKEITSIDIVNLVRVLRKTVELPTSLKRSEIIGRILSAFTKPDGESENRHLILSAINASSSIYVDEQVFDAILRLASENDSRLRNIAIKCLVSLVERDSSAVLANRLGYSLRSSSRVERLTALEIITKVSQRQFPDNFMELIEPLMASRWSEERRFAIMAFAVLNKASATTVSRLNDLANNSKRAVRAAAIEALGLMNGPAFSQTTIHNVIKGLTDRDTRVRFNSAVAISQAPAKFAKREILERLLSTLSKLLAEQPRKLEVDILTYFMSHSQIPYRIIAFQMLKAAALVASEIQSGETFQQLLELTRTNTWLISNYSNQRFPISDIMKRRKASSAHSWDVVYVSTSETLILETPGFLGSVVFPEEMFSSFWKAFEVDIEAFSPHPLVVLGNRLPREVVSHAVLRFFKDGAVTFTPPLLDILAALKSKLATEGLQPYVKAALNSAQSQTKLSALKLTKVFYSPDRLRSIIPVLRKCLSDESPRIQDEAWQLISSFSHTPEISK
jgi:hypothetical protein